MHPSIKQLYDLAAKPSRKIIGLMSGTSLDGLDIALCEVSGAGIQTQMKLLHFVTIPFDTHFKNHILDIFSKQQVSLEKLTLLNPWVALQHAKMINKALSDWKVSKSEVDLIASHGQTIYHAPKSLHPNDEFGPATLQIGDGDHLAVGTGIITISDFRQKHIAAGGEGAPLAVYGDYLICTSSTENRLLLNIGGIANYTYLPAGCALDQVFSTDTGPGNTIMDAYMRKHFNLSFDQDGLVAKKGVVNEKLLNTLLADSFFKVSLPKTIGPELFNLDYLTAAQMSSGTQSLSHEDIMATLNKLTAISIADAINAFVPSGEKYTLYTSGGGMHNLVMVAHLAQLLPNATIQSSALIGLEPDAKEAILFALLANETVAGSPMYAGGNATKLPITMGKISLPQ
jgi:anhydro-N-acetylmuramic acid kinase